MTEVQVKRYNFVAMLLHWAIFLLLVYAIYLGWSTESLPKEKVREVMQIHKSVGLTILLLSLFRLAWRIMNPPPALPPMSRRDQIIMAATHHTLYALMIGIPLIGWVMISSSSFKFPTKFWGTFEIPLLPLTGMETVHHVTEFLHSKLVWVGIVLVALHFAAALKHQFVDKDNLIKRMLPF